MSAIVLFMAVIAVIVGWWLSQQRLTAKPWLEEGAIGDYPGTDTMTWPAAKIGLACFSLSPARCSHFSSARTRCA